jgi:thiamine-monophosphate kinase
VKEHDLIRALRSRAAVPPGMRGIGDDCCEWTPGGRTSLSIDTVVEGVHFLPTDAPTAVGRKAAAAALSDLAATGARPVGAVVGLSCPARWNGLAVMDGLLAELTRHGCALLGGDTTGAQQLTISVTVWGEAAGQRLLHRDGGQAGDLLVVTGPLGGSFASGRHLRPEPRFAEGAWLAASPYVHACMDISDGLAGDAPTLAAASSLGCLLLPNQVPVHPDVVGMDTMRAACCDGEDFELLAAIAPEHWPHVQLAWPFSQPLAVVGWLTPELEHSMEDSYGRRVPLSLRGYEHPLTDPT